MPFGITYATSSVYAFKKIDNDKVVGLYNGYRLMTFDACTGKFVKEKPIDERVLSSKAYLERIVLKRKHG